MWVHYGSLCLFGLRPLQRTFGCHRHAISYSWPYLLCNHYQIGLHFFQIHRQRYILQYEGILYSLSWIVLTVSLMNFIFLRSGLVAYGLAIAFAVIYSIYLLVDTQMILGNREKRIDLDNYILGAVILYMDIISLFLKLLRILGKKKDEWSL